MTVVESLASFTLAAGLLVVTPGLDTVLVLRTATAEGGGRAMQAAAGICCGCLVWGAAVALGLVALLAVSTVAFTLLRWAGAAYLVWLGTTLLLRPRQDVLAAGEPRPNESARRGGWFWKGMLQNLLNPKVGVFYVSFLPQFVPPLVPVAGYTLMLAAVQAVLGLAWLSLLIAAMRPIIGLLRRPGVIRTLDRLTGGMFIGFGVALAASRR